MALRRRGLAAEVSGFARREATAREALHLGAVDVASDHLPTVLEGADLVVLCTPVGQMSALVAQFPGALTPGAVVTDVGSVKVAVVQEVEESVFRAGGHFVGSHPMAGSERTGVAAAREDLFCGAMAVVTPTTLSHPGAVESMVRLWELVGARVLQMSPSRHDTLVSRTSHLPHLAAAALAHYILAPATELDVGPLCATGFRDTTRVAMGSTEMWRDIALANRETILEALGGFAATLGRLQDLIRAGDGEGIESFLREARERRTGWAGTGGKAVNE